MKWTTAIAAEVALIPVVSAEHALSIDGRLLLALLLFFLLAVIGAAILILLGKRVDGAS